MATGPVVRSQPLRMAVPKAPTFSDTRSSSFPTDQLFQNSGSFESSSSDFGAGSREGKLSRSASASSPSSPSHRDQTPSFFRRILVPAASLRRVALENAIETLRQSVDGYRPYSSTDSWFENGSGGGSGSSTPRPLLLVHLPIIVRLAVEAPFADVREAFSDLLNQSSSELGIAIPRCSRSPSRFIPVAQAVPPEPDTEPLRSIFHHVFLRTGMVSHLERVLAYQPNALEAYWVTYHYVLRETGPLPLSWRNYIAVLAAARHRCEYLVRRQEVEFIANGGDESWLGGIANIPRKLANLLEMNQILAHQPWRLQSSHVAVLLKGADSWSIAELVHAIVLMCTFHSLAGFVMGCGVTLEADIMPTAEASSSDTEEQPINTSENPEAVASTAEIIQLLRNWEKAQQCPSPPRSEPIGLGVSMVDDEDAHDDTPSFDVEKYVGQYKMSHVDFIQKSSEYAGLRVQEYDWKSHGYSLVNRFYPGVAPLLDREFNVIYDLTDNSFSTAKNLDTRPFRYASWHYVHLVMGLTNDDFQYHQVNVILNRSIKRYMKKAVCFPENLSRHDFVNFGYDMLPAEKAHVTLLAVEARKEASLLYGLHAVMQHMLFGT